jgi:hypothetical protein
MASTFGMVVTGDRTLVSTAALIMVLVTLAPDFSADIGRATGSFTTAASLTLMSPT